MIIPITNCISVVSSARKWLTASIIFERPSVSGGSVDMVVNYSPIS